MLQPFYHVYKSMHCDCLLSQPLVAPESPSGNFRNHAIVAGSVRTSHTLSRFDSERRAYSMVSSRCSLVISGTGFSSSTFSFTFVASPAASSFAFFWGCFRISESKLSRIAARDLHYSLQKMIVWFVARMMIG